MRITPHRRFRSLASRAAGAVIGGSGGLGAHGFRKRAAHEESSCRAIGTNNDDAHSLCVGNLHARRRTPTTRLTHERLGRA